MIWKSLDHLKPNKPENLSSNYVKFHLQFITFLHEHMYSHLSNKREVTLADLEKFHPPQKNPPPRLLISLQNFPIFLQNLMTIFLTVILSYKTLF